MIVENIDCREQSTWSKFKPSKNRKKNHISSNKNKYISSSFIHGLFKKAIWKGREV